MFISASECKYISKSLFIILIALETKWKMIVLKCTVCVLLYRFRIKDETIRDSSQILRTHLYLKVINSQTRSIIF